MSPSSAFSHRRQLLRRPKICLPPPPPPPPPPPDDWPPDCFPVHVDYGFDWEEGPISRSFDTEACLDPDGPWWWATSFAPNGPNTAEWVVNPVLWLATLTISGDDPDWGEWFALRALIAVTPYVPTLYVISTWDEKPNETWSIAATFTF